MPIHPNDADYRTTPKKPAQLRTPAEPERAALGVRRMKMIVVDDCPFCHEKHRYRSADFSDHVGAHCGRGTIVLTERV